MKYYSVTAKCGHVGRKYYIPIEFATVADSGKEAAAKIRSIPHVKHHHKDAIIAVKEINYKQYLDLVKTNRYDPYLHCKNKQEQALVMDDIMPRICEEQNAPYYDVLAKEEERKQYYAGKQHIRNVRRYIKGQMECVRLSTARQIA